MIKDDPGPKSISKFYRLKTKDNYTNKKIIIAQIIGPKLFNPKAYLFHKILEGWEVQKRPLGFNEVQGTLPQRAGIATPPQ